MDAKTPAGALAGSAEVTLSVKANQGEKHKRNTNPSPSRKEREAKKQKPSVDKAKKQKPSVDKAKKQKPSIDKAKNPGSPIRKAVTNPKALEGLVLAVASRSRRLSLSPPHLLGSQETQALRSSP
jgi:hypothetical protein